MQDAVAIHEPSKTQTRRLRLTIGGRVQGVGFRPFVYRLANDLGLAGSVENTPQGVTVEIEGCEERLAEFRRRLESDKPRLALIQSCEVASIDACDRRGFTIKRSALAGATTAVVLPDMATCPDCVNDIMDPANGRYRYPFTNCTHCGPRFSIITALPYDRANTTMCGFTMCPACRREYDDPADRRFHAQPNACPLCGPHLELWDGAGRAWSSRDDALCSAAETIRRGGVLALKGLGGFQLMVDARNPAAVADLRRRKRREDKPFALMASSLLVAEALCAIDPTERLVLQSPQAPIVLMRRREPAASPIAQDVAPGNPYFGIMLPYTPLHHLLMRELGFPVVATSGNVADEPICTDEREAVRRLHGLADVFLVHDRPIVRPVDDSVVRIIRGRETVIRRARGYAPLSMPVANLQASILAVGAQQKNTVALATHGQVFVSQHVGDLTTQPALEAFNRATIDLAALYDARPRLVACDLHPDYVSSKCAERMPGRVVRVQHHHAHVVSCMVENELNGTVLGVAWDGAGYGPDGTVWGGEFLRCDRGGFDRVAHLRLFALPGGDLAAREPRRAALGLLYELFGDRLFDRPDLAPLDAFPESERRILRHVLRNRVNCPVTSSMGRLFDAVASIVGIGQRVNSEGRAATELEFAAESVDDETTYPFTIERVGVQDNSPISSGATAPWVIDWGPMVAAILDDVERSARPNRIARRFHNTLVEIIVSVARRADERVVLSGGCFQNRLLLETTIARLENEGFRPYWHHLVPCNDGGISLGQAVVAGASLAES
ncbi:MAG: carbamoyltransferase HypF [Phycisphaerales bacterium]|nr:carbamoyltransferase HypF [Phycisphaerales bacterium]